MSKPSWYAAHLHYCEPWEEILSQFLYPWIQEHLVPQNHPYFFIRYWEMGPHIRFRFKCSDNDFKLLGPKLEADFDKYVSDRPSSFEFYDFTHAHQIPKSWRLNNSLYWMEYYPETERYGGEAALPICEEAFQISSRACLETFVREKEWNYNLALTAAIQMHALFTKALGMSRGESRDFFNLVSISWFPRAVDPLGTISESLKEQKQEETMKAFEDQYERQKQQLAPFISTIYNALEEDLEEMLEPEMHSFFVQTAENHKYLEELYQRSMIEDSGWLKYVDNTGITPNKKALWAIYSSLVHMTNNRLGILNRDESYIAYLLKEAQ
ncbi:MAG: thiopeptide-type bacteriocin biosynthesis protein [Luteibaculum sp.]